MGDVTHLLDRWNAGDTAALQELLAVVHSELRRLAAGILRHERSDHTLQPTDLVMKPAADVPARDASQGRRHFYGAAAEVAAHPKPSRVRAAEAGGPGRIACRSNWR
jgi:hypothetical protein